MRKSGLVRITASITYIGEEEIDVRIYMGRDIYKVPNDMGGEIDGGIIY